MFHPWFCYECGFDSACLPARQAQPPPYPERSRRARFRSLSPYPERSRRARFRSLSPYPERSRRVRSCNVFHSGILPTDAIGKMLPQSKLPVHPPFKFRNTFPAYQYVFFIIRVSQDNFQPVGRICNDVVNC